MRRLTYAQRHRCICLVTNHMEERTSPPEIQPGDALGLRKTSMDLFDGDSLDSFGDRPLIAERVNHGRHSIALNGVAWFLDRSCACIHGTSENKIDIRDVNIECTAGRLTMRVMAVRDAAARDTAITHTPEFVRFGWQSNRASASSHRSGSSLAAVGAPIGERPRHHSRSRPRT